MVSVDPSLQTTDSLASLRHDARQSFAVRPTLFFQSVRFCNAANSGWRTEQKFRTLNYCSALFTNRPAVVSERVAIMLFAPAMWTDALAVMLFTPAVMIFASAEYVFAPAVVVGALAVMIFASAE